MKARLSVALCTYNGAAFLKAQLDSIVAQDRRPDELVVRDDASTDDTLAILHAFAERAPFPVRLLDGRVNMGYAKNFEATIAACTGDLIALSDQDDVWLPHKLKRLETALGDDPTALLAFSDAILVSEDLKPLERTMWEAVRLDPAIQQRLRKGGARSPLFRGTFVTGATTCFRSSLIPLALPLGVPRWHDAWLAVIASLYGHIVPVAEPLILYRQHGRNELGAPALDGHIVARAVRALRHDPVTDARITEMARHVQELLEQARCRAELLTGGTATGEALSQAVAHHAFRASLPTHPSRTWAVLRELCQCQYHRYSGGAKTAARDLLRG